MNRKGSMDADVRLIERWLPIAAIGVESTRERTPMTPFPAPNRLHVWWARRPLVASRAAVLASILPADADRDRFLHILGIHGDPVAARSKINQARRTGIRVINPYGYDRAFKYCKSADETTWLRSTLNRLTESVSILDPTAGGGSIPFEALRMGVHAHANDLNPVAALLLHATVKWPAIYSNELQVNFEQLAARWRKKLEVELSGLFPESGLRNQVDQTYLWARTITCPYCAGLVPLSPNWRLSSDGTGVALRPHLSAGPGSRGRVCAFEIVNSITEQSGSTVKRGVATCPYPDCGRVIAGSEIKSQAQAGQMGEQLYTIVYKQRIPTILKSGKPGKDKWKRGFRLPRNEDDNNVEIQARLADKMLEWETLDMVPIERIPVGNKTTEPHRYGMMRWRDLFSTRQLLCHGTSVEIFREMLQVDQEGDKLGDVQKAAYGYLALTLSRMCDYDSRMCVWHSYRSVIGHTFSQHDFSFKWSYAEMSPLVARAGYDWAIRQTSKCISELVSLVQPTVNDLFDTDESPSSTPPPITISCKSGDSLDHIETGSIDVVVMDPPYYDNVMYAELSDFFYVWLKRMAGHVFPELFRRALTDKENEAVANPAKFKGQKGARSIAGQDYQFRMAAIFAESHRVLKVDGIMTIMFTHRASGAWDSLTRALMEAGFTITASWPINTEASGSLHIRNKASAKSTIFLVCRPRSSSQESTELYWEDIEPRVSEAVRQRVGDFQQSGISGVDLFLASFGPALEEFSRHWPLRRGTPRLKPKSRNSTLKLDQDPYLATPEDALNAARREVKQWRLNQLVHQEANAELDPVTAFVVLAWDTFRAPTFAYDEALQLSRAVGVDLDREILGRLAEKNGSNLTIWDSTRRAAKGALGPINGSRTMMDPIHHAAHIARTVSLSAAIEHLQQASMDRHSGFHACLKALLEVLPPSTTHTRVILEGDLLTASMDFEALYNLARLYFSDQVEEPQQLNLWQDD